MNPVGIGIVGAGRIFEQHAIAYNALGGRARLLAVSDIDDLQVRKATSQHFIPFAYNDHRKLLERKDIDAVLIATHDQDLKLGVHQSPDRSLPLGGA